MPSYYDIIGNDLIDCNNNKYDLKTTTTNKYFGLYFSAKWCGPCRNFTPKLIDYYNNLNGTFEVIFISLDNNDIEFSEYFSKMPWKSLPFDSEKSEKLSDFFGVEGIPTLILIDNFGNIISKNGKDMIQDNNSILEKIMRNCYNYKLFETANSLIRGQGDGRLSENDALILLEVINKKELCINDYKTIIFILHNYKFTDKGINIFLNNLQ